MQFIICDSVTKYDLLSAILYQNAIYYMRLCINMRFIICDFASKCDLLYAAVFQNPMCNMRLCIKIRFIIFDLLYSINICEFVSQW